MKKTVLLFTLSFSLSLSLLFSSVSFAFGPEGDSSENVIKYRQYVMTAMSNHFKALKFLATGRICQPAQWLPHARSMVDMANMIESTFPPESDFGDTEAKEEIWENKGDFNQKALKLIKASEAMVRLIEANERDKAIEQIKVISNTCKSCHKKYREL